MNKQLAQQLLKMDEVEFRLLDLNLNISKQLRKMQQQFELSDAELCKEMKIEPKDLKKWKNACKEFDMRDVAMLESVYLRLSQKELEKSKEHIVFETPLSQKEKK